MRQVLLHEVRLIFDMMTNEAFAHVLIFTKHFIALLNIDIISQKRNKMQDMKTRTHIQQNLKFESKIKLLSLQNTISYFAQGGSQQSPDKD